MGRKVIQDGFLGKGRIECDGKDHWMVREEHEKLNCLQETHVGPCGCGTGAFASAVIVTDKPVGER